MHESIHPQCFVVIQMQRLRCFMYVSTAYANSHSGIRVALEQLYPLHANGTPLDHAAVTQYLLSLSPEQALIEVNLMPN